MRNVFNVRMGGSVVNVKRGILLQRKENAWKKLEIAWNGG